jgi:phage tail sheath protein FI
MGFNLGLNIVEVDGRVAPSIQAAPTSVAALVIRAERGLPDAVYRVTNWSEFIEHFGSYMDGAYGAYAMRGFIDNGGAVAYVTRVFDETTAVSASRSFDDGAAAALTVTAGYRGQEDKGAWGNGIAVRITENSEESATYDLTVSYKGDIVETWEQLNHDATAGTPGGAPGQRPAAVINDEFTGS